MQTSDSRLLHCRLPTIKFSKCIPKASARNAAGAGDGRRSWHCRKPVLRNEINLCRNQCKSWVHTSNIQLICDTSGILIEFSYRSTHRILDAEQGNKNRQKSDDKYAKRERFIFFKCQEPGSRDTAPPDTADRNPTHSGQCDSGVTGLWRLIDMQMVRIRARISHSFRLTWKRKASAGEQN